MSQKKPVKKIIKYIIYIMFAVMSVSAYFGVPIIQKNTNLLPVIGPKSSNAEKKNPYVLRKEDRSLNLIKTKNDFKVNFEGKAIDLKSPIYVETNRYFLPVNELLPQIDGNMDVNDDNISLEAGDVKIDITAGGWSYNKNGTRYNLRKPTVMIGRNLYMSTFDFVKAFDLNIKWDINENSIDLYKARKSSLGIKQEAFRNPEKKRVALIRLEDLWPGYKYDNTVALQKLRAEADLLYSYRIPFHVAWVPKFVDPKQGIDVDLCENESLFNDDFVYTLDYLLDRGAIFGLHGYTHQYGSDPTFEGTEFGKDFYSSEKDARDRIESAIKYADKLDIPYSFFETPHYDGTKEQFKVFEEYFDYIYQPDLTQVKDEVVKKRIGNRVVRYVPAPLSYIRGKDDVENMRKKIQKLPNKQLASFFFHPFVDFENINVKEESDGYPEVEYTNASILNGLIKVFDENGYRFDRITNLE